MQVRKNSGRIFPSRRDDCRPAEPDTEEGWLQTLLRRRQERLPGGRLKTVFLSATATGKGERPARTLLHGKHALTLWGRGGKLLYPTPRGTGEDPTWLEKG